MLTAVAEWANANVLSDWLMTIGYRGGPITHSEMEIINSEWRLWLNCFRWGKDSIHSHWQLFNSSLRNSCICFYMYIFIIVYWGSRDGAVSTATRYGLEGPGFESRCGARFSAPIQARSEAYPESYTMGTWSLPRVQRPGLGLDQ